MCSRSEKQTKSFLGLAGARKFILVLGMLAAAACQPAINTVTLPAPKTWKVQVTPALRWLGPIFNECTRQVPGIALLYDEEPPSALDLSNTDFTFSFSEPVNGAGYTAVMAQVGLAVIVNPANPISQLDTNSLAAIYSGKVVAWGELPAQDCPDCKTSPENPIKPYVYAEGDDLGRGFSDLFPGLPQRLPTAILAPDPQAVRQAVAADPQAVGYIPMPVVDSSVRAVNISDFAAGGMRIPLLLSTQAEPEGAQRSWVLCIQQTIH
jgi:hypothetical protein